MTIWITLSPLVVALMAVLLVGTRPARALPEYATRTGEPCATCHVSPGGGGPRTLRGMLWVADDRPDEVSAVDTGLLAPGVDDPLVLYDVACAGCHGSKGEGLSATPLTGYDFSESLIESMIEEGAPRSGMPAFEGQFTEAQIAALVDFVQSLSSGEIVPPDSYPLPEPALGCVTRVLHLCERN